MEGEGHDQERMMGEDKITDGSGFTWNLDFKNIYVYT